MSVEPDEEESGPRDTDQPPAPIDSPTEPRVPVALASEGAPESAEDLEQTVSLTGNVAPDPLSIANAHLRGLLEALIFASDKPIKALDLAKSAAAPIKDVRDILTSLKEEYAPRGVQLDEVAGGWLFRTSVTYAPFVRDLTKQRPVKLTRAQLETLAILAYRQPITRPEIDDIRGVDSGPVLKILLERDLIRILGKKDEPGRPLLYGTTTSFLELFGLRSLKDLPTLREFTELTEDSRRVVERELGEVLDATLDAVSEAPGEGGGRPLDATDESSRDTLTPAPPDDEEPPPATQAGSQVHATVPVDPVDEDDPAAGPLPEPGEETS